MFIAKTLRHVNNCESVFLCRRCLFGCSVFVFGFWSGHFRVISLPVGWLLCIRRWVGWGCSDGYVAEDRASVNYSFDMIQYNCNS